MLPSGSVSILVEDLWFTTCSGYSDQYELPAGNVCQPIWTGWFGGSLAQQQSLKLTSPDHCTYSETRKFVTD